jgi:putative flippase GtrA
MPVTTPQRYQHALRKRFAGSCTDADVLVVEADGQAIFPQVCVNCCRPARSRLLVEKVFSFHIEDMDGNYWSHSVGGFRVPVCDDCMTTHRAEGKPVGLWRRLLRVLSGGSGIGGFVIFGCGVFFAVAGLLELNAGSVLMFIIACTAWLAGGFLLRSAWNDQRRHAVAPQTSISSAVDFTELLSDTFEPAWRAFSFRNREYARMFREANADRLWDFKGSAARAAREKRNRRGRFWKRLARFGNFIVAIALGSAVLWFVYTTFVRPIWKAALGQ